MYSANNHSVLGEKSRLSTQKYLIKLTEDDSHNKSRLCFSSGYVEWTTVKSDQTEEFTLLADKGCSSSFKSIIV